ncbi:GNAT family N-acetyltransferase [Adhaeribacter radiodurans]|uniref:GNAT family N-acetyltransferase n=1 Tax=Adhaeribacter radiodurans TaxID=2745197 RepID=A0A7L7L5S8_9BACT|nr:GNAT family N-acetyltransferase [Adhaeribacter radiodurans]QMU28172.1 GNAT family N-acetyltransferase [Adhaeribacter radiodurans]
MKGVISLRVDRHPDFFELLRQRGEFIALVAENENKEIVGCFTAARQNFMYRQNQTPVFYLGDLKVHPFLKGSSLAYRLVGHMYDELKKHNADLLLCTAADGNQAVMPFFDGRLGIPQFKRMGRFFIYQVLPRRTSPGYHVLEGIDVNNKLNCFYTSFYQRYRFHPVINHLDGCIHFIKENSGFISAAISITDTSSYKQNVVLDYPFSLALLLNLLKGVSAFISIPTLPQKNEALRIAYVRYLGVENNKEADLVSVIQQARHWAFDNNYHFLNIAINENDERLIKLMDRWKQFIFISHGLLTSLAGHSEMVDEISHSVIYEDFSLV